MGAWVVRGINTVFVGFCRFYWVLQHFTEFSGVLLGVTGFL